MWGTEVPGIVYEDEAREALWTELLELQYNNGTVAWNQF